VVFTLVFWSLFAKFALFAFFWLFTKFAVFASFGDFMGVMGDFSDMFEADVKLEESELERSVTSSAGFVGTAKLRMLLYNKRAVFLGVYKQVR